MSDPRPYRSDRSEVPAEGAAQTVADEESSLPPGVHTRPDRGPRGDGDRAEPYTGDPSPLRMVEEPFPTGNQGDVGEDDQGL